MFDHLGVDLKQDFIYNQINRSARLDLYGWEWAGSLYY